MLFHRSGIVLLFCAWCLFLCACTEQTPPQGTVARVNNQIITLSMLEARHDFDFIITSGDRVPTPEALQAEYAASLTTLVIQALIDQYLEKNKLSITPAEVAAEEEKIRADYPPGEFERILVEDYVDIDVWREFLRQGLARRKLNEKVLRPAITVSAEEMEQYYKANIAKFSRAARVRILVANSADREKLEDARKEYLTSKDIRALEGKDGILVQTITPQPEHLPKDLRESIQAFSSGDATAISQANESYPYKLYQFMVLEERIPAKDATLLDVYPRVEQALVEQKLEDVFWEWLERELRRSKIEIAHALAETATLAPEALKQRARESRIKKDAFESAPVDALMTE